MTRYRLIIYDQISRRMRWRLALLLLTLILVGVYDRTSGYLGRFWFGWWFAIFLLAAMFIYYAAFYRRASIQVGEEKLRFQGVMAAYEIGLDNVASVATGTLEQHFSWKELSGYERKILKNFYFQTCVFIQLREYPDSFKSRRLWFPRCMFSPTRPGIICHVDDWMALSNQVDKARDSRVDESGRAHISNRRTLVGRILAEELEFN